MNREVKAESSKQEMGLRVAHDKRGRYGVVEGEWGSVAGLRGGRGGGLL